jgi:hypothetical protein
MVRVPPMTLLFRDLQPDKFVLFTIWEGACAKISGGM